MPNRVDGDSNVKKPSIYSTVYVEQSTETSKGFKFVRKMIDKWS